MKKKSAYLFILLALGFSMALAHAQAISTLTVLHTFGITNGAIVEPGAPVVQGPDGTLYGTAIFGDAGVHGGVFKVQTNGTGFTVLKYFINSATDGQNPQAGLVLSGSTLYGTTRDGGPGQAGTLFAINTDGTGFTNLYIFGSLQFAADGAIPQAGLILSGGKLYGTTVSGGANNAGVIFAINTDGTDYTNFYNFSALVNNTNSDGANPYGTLLLSGSTLYGTASAGGTNGNGTVFAVQTDSTGFTNLYNFSALVSATNSDGAVPESTLILSGSTLYGTASAGGNGGSGTVFAINTSGTGFTNLYSFSTLVSATNSDGANPYAGVVLSGGTLFGMTVNGGSGRHGTVFAVGTNGTGFTNYHTFASGFPNDGNEDFPGENVGNTLILSGSTLYGTTVRGGNDGTIFEMNTDGTGYAIVFTLGPVNVGDPQSKLVLSGGTLFGTTRYGGSANNGTVFAVNTNGTGYTILHSFSATVNNTNSDGVNPLAGLVLSGSTLYGTAGGGGVNNGYGTIFAISTNGTGFTNLYSFTGGSDGRTPSAGLILSGSTLYGTAQGNGSGGSGTVFSVNISGSPFNVLHSFSALVNNTNSDGASPTSELILSGSTLYGAAQIGGTGGSGTVFAVNTNGSGFTNLHSFSANTYDSSHNDFTNSEGSTPQSGLILSGGTLYGTTVNGGIDDSGTVFAVNTNGTGYTVLYTFLSGPGNEGNPSGDLILSGRTLIGTVQNNGVFAINTNGTGYIILYTLNQTTEGSSPSAGMVMSGSTLYGTAQSQGTGGWGTVFALTPLPIPLNIQSGNNSVVLSWLNPLLSLQSAPVVTGSFTNMPAAYSPYTNATTTPQRFFRLQSQ